MRFRYSLPNLDALGRGFAIMYTGDGSSPTWISLVSLLGNVALDWFFVNRVGLGEFCTPEQCLQVCLKCAMLLNLLDSWDDFMVVFVLTPTLVFFCLMLFCQRTRGMQYWISKIVRTMSHREARYHNFHPFVDIYVHYHGTHARMLVCISFGWVVATVWMLCHQLSMANGSVWFSDIARGGEKDSVWWLSSL